MKELSPVIQDALVTIITLALSILSVYATLYLAKLKARATEEVKNISDKRQRELLISAIQDVDYLVRNAVKAAEQTTARELRALVKEGKADRSSLVDLGKRVKWKLYTELAPKTKSLLEKNFGDVNKYIEMTMESALHDLKEREREQLMKAKLISTLKEDKEKQGEEKSEVETGTEEKKPENLKENKPVETSKKKEENPETKSESEMTQEEKSDTVIVEGNGGV